MRWGKENKAMTKNATCAGKGVISDKMVNEVEVEDPNADLSQSGCGVNGTKEKQPGNVTQEPKNKQPGNGQRVVAQVVRELQTGTV